MLARLCSFGGRSNVRHQTRKLSHQWPSQSHFSSSSHPPKRESHFSSPPHSHNKIPQQPSGYRNLTRLNDTKEKIKLYGDVEVVPKVKVQPGTAKQIFTDHSALKSFIKWAANERYHHRGRTRKRMGGSTESDIFKELYQLLEQPSSVQEYREHMEFLQLIWAEPQLFEKQVFEIPAAGETQAGTSGPKMKSVLLTRRLDQHVDVMPWRTVLHFHGNGFISGSPTSCANSIADIYQRCCPGRILIPAYRLMPEFSIDDAVEDALTAYNYLINDLEIKPQDLVIVAESGGATVAIQMLRRLNIQYHKKGAKRKESLARLYGSKMSPHCSCFVGISPILDLTLGTVQRSNHDVAFSDQIIDLMKESIDTAIPQEEMRIKSSPMSLEACDVDGMPPMMFFSDLNEPFYEECTHFHERMKHFGHDSRLENSVDQFHGYPMRDFFPEAVNARHQLNQWIILRSGKDYF